LLVCIWNAGAKKRDNRLDAKFQTPPPQDFDEFKRMFPGEAWASQHGHAEYDNKGGNFQNLFYSATCAGLKIS